ncbi:MAG: hypothetical protein CO090_05920 [Acidobacteria bacterium CG_4_9_14_3_um_filter_49_7]|nr:MAG: hypothetical protein CO090_05920 [Acidobacteria bacterium CG_4_9_14_3_um_filter_49_7]
MSSNSIIVDSIRFQEEKYSVTSTRQRLHSLPSERECLLLNNDFNRNRISATYSLKLLTGVRLKFSK